MAEDQPVQPSGDGGLSEEEASQIAAKETKPGRSAIIRANGRRVGEEEEVRIETHDFRNPVFLTEVEMRHLRVLHEELTRLLEARLSLLLRLEFGLEVADFGIVSYQDFTGGMKNPTHVCLFKADPVSGIGLLDISPRLALTIAGRMLGGDGSVVQTERHLTEIESDLINEVILLVVEEWSKQWKFEQTLEPMILGHEVNGRFLQTCQRGEIMLVLGLKAELRDCSEAIRIGVPAFMVEPMVRQLQLGRKRTVAASGPEKKGEWRTAYESIRLKVTAQWDAKEFTVEDILKFKEGDVIPLSPDLLENTQLCLAGVPAFNCEAGVENGRIALRIKEKLEKEIAHVFE